MRSQPASYHGYRFPPDIISHAVWLYCSAHSVKFADDTNARSSSTSTHLACQVAATGLSV